jgi:hypothetical protein
MGMWLVETALIKQIEKAEQNDDGADGIKCGHG